MNRMFYAVRDFLVPPKCPGCYEIFRVHYGEKNEMCPSCEKKWAILKATICSDCGERFTDCRCVTSELRRAGVSSLLKLVPYTKRRSVSNNTVLYIKKRRDRRVFSFICGELAYELGRYADRLGVRREDAVITFCPRRRGAINEFGFDHARTLAYGISKLTGMQAVDAVTRSFFFGRAQKKLNAKKRARNVRGAFRLSADADIKNKTVFLVDDLVTTGATMAECARCLKRGGAALIIGVAIAKTEDME